MAGRISVGQKELLRSKVLEIARQRKMTLKAAAVMTRANCRQAKRLNAAYRKEGDAGLVHGNRGRRSSNRIAEEVREKALLPYKERYNGFGSVFASEKLAEEERTAISASALRNALMEAGEWKGRRRAKEYRSRRERRARFDGSRHKWFEDRSPSCCLMTMTGGAANTRTAGFSSRRR